MDVTGGPLLQRLMVVNVMLAAFNLLPAFPMDGGRVLRALLARTRPRGEATRIAATVGQALALLLGLFGLLYNPFLMFIALFVWIGAAAEADTEEAKEALAGLTVGDAMLTDFRTLATNDNLNRAAEFTLAGSQKDFPVVERGDVVGVLLQADLLGGLQRRGGEAPVGELMSDAAQAADVGELLTSALQRLQGTHCRLLSVTRDGHMVGIIDLDNIVEMINFQRALHSRQSAIKGETDHRELSPM
jgi:predicted transcriptional regulator